MYELHPRFLIIDDSLNKRLATELRSRGRMSCSLGSLGLRGALDPPMLREVFRWLDDPVLITGDDDMPDTHAAAVAEIQPTLAIVAPGDPQDPNEDAHEREIVHRWAHVMHVQPTGTIRRYRLSGARDWSTRKR